MKKLLVSLLATSLLATSLLATAAYQAPSAKAAGCTTCNVGVGIATAALIVAASSSSGYTPPECGFMMISAWKVKPGTLRVNFTHYDHYMGNSGDLGERIGKERASIFNNRGRILAADIKMKTIQTSQNRHFGVEQADLPIGKSKQFTLLVRVPGGCDQHVQVDLSRPAG